MSESKSTGNKPGHNASSKGFVSTPPVKPLVPTAKPDLAVLESYPITKDMTAKDINAIYEAYLMKKEDVKALAESRRDEVEKVLSERKGREKEENQVSLAFGEINTVNMIIQYYAEKLNKELLTQGLNLEQIKNVIKRAFLEYRYDSRAQYPYNGTPDNVFTQFTNLIIDMVQDNANWEPLPINEYELRYNTLSNLEVYGIRTGEIDRLIDLDKVTNATRIFEEVKNKYQEELKLSSSSPKGYSQYKEQSLEGFILLGFSIEEAEVKVVSFLTSISKEI